MNPEIKKLWIEALESGDYKHGTGSLRNDANEFCCLGVLCNLHAQAHPEFAVTQTANTVYLEQSYYLPKEVRQWAGLPESFGPTGFCENTNRSLSALNDASTSFAPVIALIKKYL